MNKNILFLPIQVLPLLTLAFVPQQSADFCSFYTEARTFILSAAAVVSVIGIMIVGIRRLLATIFPDWNIQMGDAAGKLFIGLALIGFAPTIADMLAGWFGLSLLGC